jgi:hypothetical protein
MPATDLSNLKRTEHRVRRVRGDAPADELRMRAQSVATAVATAQTRTAAPPVAVPAPLRTTLDRTVPTAPPTDVGELCRLDAKGRFYATAAVTELGWAPQDLTVAYQMPWVLLQPTGDVTTRRYRPRLSASGRITLPIATRYLLGVTDDRSKVYAHPMPSRDALALLNAAHLLAGLPRLEATR